MRSTVPGDVDQAFAALPWKPSAVARGEAEGNPAQGRRPAGRATTPAARPSRSPRAARILPVWASDLDPWPASQWTLAKRLALPVNVLVALAFIGIAGAVVINVSLLLNLADHRAAARPTNAASPDNRSGDLAASIKRRWWLLGPGG
jgi:hypothetical protein